MIRNALLMVLLAAPLAQAEDWPKWLGPRGDNIIQGEKLPAELPEDLAQLWKADIGLGYSSPIAHKGRIYMFGMKGKNTDTLTCLDAEKGTVIWEQSYEGGYTGSYKGTRATPTIDGDRIYTYGGNSDLYCRQLADGKELWHINVLKDTGAKNQQWGTASSPLIDGDTIYVAGGVDGPAAVAVNKKTGDYIWKSEAKGGGYAAMILADIEGARQLIAFGNKHIYGMNPADGKTLWSHPWETQYDVNAATPIFHNGHLFISSDYNHGCIMFKLSAKGAEVAWENKLIELRYQPAILENGHLYANSEGVLKCITWPDGKLKWQVKESGLVGNGGSIVRVAPDRLIILSDRGKLTLAKASPDGLEKQGTAEAIDGREVWSSPLFYNGRFYLKGTSELVCLEAK